MNINSVRGRGAAVVASLALVGTGVTLATVPAQSAPPAEDCAEPVDVDTLSAGDLVEGLTVSRGTTPEQFTGEILGVISNGIAPGLDMVMAELSSPAIDDAGGIWAGMSGSPVYAAGTDDIIGAVAYGLTWGSTPVAGITPFNAMDDYLPEAAAAGKVKVSDSQAKAIAAATDVTRAQARQGFSQLPMETSISGLTKSRLRKMRKKGPDYVALKGVRAGGVVSAAAAAGPETLVAGGNLGAAFSYGDITIGGVGTVTSVCNGELVGFGHPMQFDGETLLGMMPADAVFVQPDPLGVAFKVANMGAPAGTIDQDRLTGISGPLDVLPVETDISSVITSGTRSLSGTSHSLAPDYNAGVAFSHLLASQDRVFDAIGPGSSAVDVTITGTDADDAPFAIEFSDRYMSRWDISFFSVMDTADLVWVLSRMKGVTVDEVAVDSDLTTGKAAWRVVSAEQRRGGSWVELGRKSPAVTKAGGTLRLRATLARGSQRVQVPLTLAVPVDAKRRGFLDVSGGASDWDGITGKEKTPAALEAALADRVRNDQVSAALILPKRGPDRVVKTASAQQSLVVRGGKWAEVIVRR